MGEKELSNITDTEFITIIVIFTLIVLAAITGVMIFLFQYRKRKIIHLAELELIENQHKIDLLNAQVQVQKDTMSEIGKELHDNLGQKVTLASIYLQQIPIKNDMETLKDDTLSVNTLLNEILQEMRRMSKALVTDLSENASLEGLITDEAKRISHYANIDVTTDMKCDTTVLPVHLKNGIFRIFQEFSQNSIKHSKCKRIHVLLKCIDNTVFLQCKDDGVGFDPGQQVKGIGLTNMNRRAIELGGTLEIISKPENGTQIIFKQDLLQNKNNA